MSSTDDTPPTLADLRLRRTLARAGSRRTPQTTQLPFTSLFDLLPPEAPTVAPPAAAAAPHSLPSAPEPPRVWTVASLVRRVRALVEQSFAEPVTVEGEISNWRPAGSGHCYFTLKGGEAQLSVVMFRSQAARLTFRPKDGDAVRLRGQLSLYENRGQMQLIAASMELAGLGAQLAAVQELKARLRREGLFDRKRPLPAYPRCIGVITSLQGAALRDIVKVCRRRHAGVNLLVYPAAVQGPRCPADVTAGVRWFNAHPERVDVLLIARGGGSWEDLHGFDDEAVVRAIAGCVVPVLVGVGHATDTTLADAAADLCAPTPSAAAELVTAAQHKLDEHMTRLRTRVLRTGSYELLRARQRFLRVNSEASLRRTRESIAQRVQRVDELGFRAESAARQRLRAHAERLHHVRLRLQMQNVAHWLPALEQRAQTLHARLYSASRHAFESKRMHVEHVSSQMHALSPLRVLDRGYALVYAENGMLLRSADASAEGQIVRARLARGQVIARVAQVLPNEEVMHAEVTSTGNDMR